LRAVMQPRRSWTRARCARRVAERSPPTLEPPNTFRIVLPNLSMWTTRKAPASWHCRTPQLQAVGMARRTVCRVPVAAGRRPDELRHALRAGLRRSAREAPEPCPVGCRTAPVLVSDVCVRARHACTYSLRNSAHLRSTTRQHGQLPHPQAVCMAGRWTLDVGVRKSRPRARTAAAGLAGGRGAAVARRAASSSACSCAARRSAAAACSRCRRSAAARAARSSAASSCSAAACARAGACAGRCLEQRRRGPLRTCCAGAGRRAAASCHAGMTTPAMHRGCSRSRFASASSRLSPMLCCTACTALRSGVQPRAM